MEKQEEKTDRKTPEKTRLLKKADLVLILSVTLFSLVLSALFLIHDFRNPQPMLEVSKDGEILGVYPLDEDREFRIEGEEGYNLCRIENGTVRIMEADCRDHSCVRSLPLTKRGGTIICLPHRVVLRIIDGSGAPDAVAE